MCKLRHKDKSNCRLLIRNVQASKQLNDIFKVLKEKNPVNLEFYIQGKYSSKMKAK